MGGGMDSSMDVESQLGNAMMSDAVAMMASPPSGGGDAASEVAPGCEAATCLMQSLCTLFVIIPRLHSHVIPLLHPPEYFAYLWWSILWVLHCGPRTCLVFLHFIVGLLVILQTKLFRLGGGNKLHILPSPLSNYFHTPPISSVVVDDIPIWRAHISSGDAKQLTSSKD